MGMVAIYRSQATNGTQNLFPSLIFGREKKAYRTGTKEMEGPAKQMCIVVLGIIRDWIQDPQGYQNPRTIKSHI